jgi:polyisoprenyl-phosphate glycosyltransferase
VKAQTFVSAVVYFGDDGAEAAEHGLTTLHRYLAATFEFHEFVVVLDGPADATANAVATFAERADAPVTMLQLARRHGVEAGILAGLDRAVGDFVFEIEEVRRDYPLELLGELYERCAGGSDIVGAVTAGASRRSRLFYRFVNRVSDLRTTLGTERLRVVSRRALNAMLALKEKVRYRKALYALTGLPYTTVTYEPQGEEGLLPPRRVNRETVTLAFDILLSFSAIGLRVAFTLSIAFAAFSGLVLLYSVLIYLFARDVVPGWTTIMVIVSFGFAGLFFILGIIGEYVARILVEVRGRPVYALERARVFPSRGLGDRADLQPDAGSPFVADRRDEVLDLDPPRWPTPPTDRLPP